jgi:hypothetical protein
MNVAIRVHTPELNEACQQIAKSLGWGWRHYPTPDRRNHYFLAFDAQDISERVITCADGCGENGWVKESGALILDAKTDMDKIVEFFKTGKVKESDMGRTTIIHDVSGEKYAATRVGDVYGIQQAGCMDTRRFEKSEIEKLLKVKPEKVVKVERKICGVDFDYHAGEFTIEEYGFDDDDLDEIQAWLDDIKAAKKGAGLK